MRYSAIILDLLIRGRTAARKSLRAKGGEKKARQGLSDDMPTLASFPERVCISQRYRQREIDRNSIALFAVSLTTADTKGS